MRSGNRGGLSAAAFLATALLCGAHVAAEEPREPGVEILPTAPRGVEVEHEGREESTRERPVARDAQPLPPVVPRPYFVRNRRAIPDELLRSKREGWFVTGIPIIGGDSDRGFSYGAVVHVFDNGSREDPLFRTNPYVYKVRVVGTNTTRNRGRLFAGLDAPNVADSPWSLRASVGYLSEPAENYFGVGEEALGRLPEAPHDRFYRYDARRVGIDGSVELDTFGGIVRPLFGLVFSRAYVTDYGEGGAPDTKLTEDCRTGKIIGCEGGWDNFVKLGITWDTLDFEPDPSIGVLAQLSTEWSTRALGSDFDYGRVTFSIQGYRNLIPDLARVILAGRFVYSSQFGDVPFFNLKTLAFNRGDRSGLGGFRTLRGYSRHRFVGDNAALANLELRWSLAEWDAGRQNFRPMLVPFVDTGRIFDRVQDTTLRRWRFGVGVGLRIVWNLSTIVGFDYAWSPERNAIYFGIDHPF